MRARTRTGMLVELAFRNLFRQRTRTALTLGAIAVGVIGLVLSAGFVEDIFVQLGEALIHSQSGHLQVARKGYFAEGTRNPEQYLITDADGLVRSIAATPGTDVVSARLDFSGLLNNGRADLSVVAQGIEPSKEARIGSYIDIVQGRQLRDGDRYDVLLGEGVAHALGLAPGSRVSMLVATPDGAMNVQEFVVAGVFRSFSKEYDARIVKMPLDIARELLDTRGANVIVVTLDDTRKTQRIEAAIDRALAGRGLESRPWQVLNDFYAKTVELYGRQLDVLRFIVLLMVVLGVTNTMNMTVYERTGEVGTMRAIGNRSRMVFSLLVTESGLLGVIGVLAGVALATLLALVISAIGIPMPPPPGSNVGYTASIRIMPSEVALAALIGVTATVAASLLPAFRVSRLPVVDALRHNA